MDHVEIEALVYKARQLRAEELSRLQGVLAERVRFYAKRLMFVLGEVAESMRHSNAWKTQHRQH